MLPKSMILLYTCTLYCTYYMEHFVALITHNWWSIPVAWCFVFVLDALVFVELICKLCSMPWPQRKEDSQKTVAWESEDFSKSWSPPSEYVKHVCVLWSKPVHEAPVCPAVWTRLVCCRTDSEEQVPLLQVVFCIVSVSSRLLEWNLRNNHSGRP